MDQSRYDLAPEKLVVGFQEGNQRRYGAQIFVLIQGISVMIALLQIGRAQACDKEVLILRGAVESKTSNSREPSVPCSFGRDLSDARQCLKFMHLGQEKYRRFKLNRIR